LISIDYLLAKLGRQTSEDLSTPRPD